MCVPSRTSGFLLALVLTMPRKRPLKRPRSNVPESSMDAFRQGDDDAALGWAEKIDLPGFFWTHALLPAVYGQLDGREDGARAPTRPLELYPDSKIEV
jgi:hypothetical protein